MTLGLLGEGDAGWSGRGKPRRIWERRVRVGQFCEIRVLPDVVDEGLGQQAGERLDKLFWKRADTFRVLVAGIMPCGVAVTLRGRG
jgi:hypothetical protein